MFLMAVLYWLIKTLCMYVCMYVGMYVCMYVCMYACMHACIHVHITKCSETWETLKEAYSYLLWQCGFRSVVIIMFWILWFHSLCQSAWPRYEIQQGHYFTATTAHTACWSNHQLKVCHTTCSYSFQAVSTFTNPFLYHPWLCSNLLKPTLHFFLQSGHLNWYMHHHSLAQAEPLLYGEI
jgi:hypothetical protein